MSILRLIPALLFGLTGLVILIYVSSLVFQAIFNNLRGLLMKNRITKRESELAKAELLLQMGNSVDALNILKNALILETKVADHGQIDKVFAHNLSVISIINRVSKDYSSLYRNIPVVQELLQTRRNLMRAYLDASLSKQAINQKRTFSLKSTSWALSEFDKKIEELSSFLKTNHQSLKSEIDRLFSSINSSDQKPEANYH